MKKILLASFFSLSLMGFPNIASAQDNQACGAVSIAILNWQSAEFLAALDKFILREGYSCTVSDVPGVPTSVFTSMAEKGQPDMSPETWVVSFPEILEPAIEANRLTLLGRSLSDGGQQGWYIPKYTAEQYPEIKTITDALNHPEIFPFDEDPSRGAVINGPQGYGGAVVTAQLFKAYDGAAKNFVLVDTGSAAGLDGAIARAYERRQNILAYYWEPTSLLGRYDMVRLAGGEHDGAEWARCTSVITCADPKPNIWMTDDVYSMVTASFVERVSQEVLDYLAKRSLDNKTLNGFLAWMSDNQATGDDGARYFLEQAPQIWQDWVSEEAAVKIKAAF